jgi:hypothetical protein
MLKDPHHRNLVSNRKPKIPHVCCLIKRHTYHHVHTNSETLIHQSYLLQPFPPVTVVSVSYYHLPPFRKKQIAGEIWKKTSCSSLSVSFLPLDSHRNQPYILLLEGISPSLITQLLYFLEGMGAMDQS